MGDKKASLRLGSRRSRILYMITALIIGVFVVYGLVSWFVFRGSQSRLVEKSKEKLIEGDAANINSAAEYVTDLLTPLFLEKMRGMTTEDFARAVINKEVLEAQRAVSDEIDRMMEVGFLGLDEIMQVMLPGAMINEPVVLLASDEGLIFRWRMPDYMLDAVNNGETYMYMEDGIPELGLQGKYLVTFNPYDWEGRLRSVTLCVKSMDEEIGALNSFFDEEQGRINLILAAVVFGSILLVIVITFFVLSHLIRKRITEPVDELAKAAEQVTEGNLDVEIKVHEGGEFEVLERAYKQMVENWRKIIEKSLGSE